MPTQFAAELRRGISDAQRSAKIAVDAGHPYEAYLHRARLAELLEMAGRHEFETNGLVEPAVLAALAEDEAALDQ
ncbi:hypothetical protein [Amycolatopsis benzoatilytica]|uniref:hypothetical protein n=1 Tax=Amycolatopsis benzoatilytica TaxID=346045 RepID=UPI00035C8AED|nr:hypothetical protein [Amycolatopsis benzoatilytica]